MSMFFVYVVYMFFEFSVMVCCVSCWVGVVLVVVLCVGLIFCGWLVYVGKIDWLFVSWMCDEVLYGELMY